jgi:hypothetical protein
MEEIRLEAQNIVHSNAGLREELLRTIEYLKGVRREFEAVKQDVVGLQGLDRQLKEKFSAIETTYFVETRRTTVSSATRTAY